MDRQNQAVSIAADCVPNIGPRGRRRRMRGFAVMTLATAGLWFWLANRHATVAAYLAIAPLAAVASLYYWQVKEQTCVVLAARGTCESDTPGPPRITGEWLVAIHRQARKVWIETLVTTLLVTVSAVAFAALR